MDEELVELLTSQVPPLWYGPSQVSNELSGKKRCWGAGKVRVSGMSWLIAEARTNALKVEPGWKPAASPYLVGTV